jgi:hypothetical protein
VTFSRSKFTVEFLNSRRYFDRQIKIMFVAEGKMDKHG